MNEMASGVGSDSGAIEYRSMIEEAYIRPIRSVIAVDDEFPSLDSVLAPFVADGSHWKGADGAKQALELMTHCRQREPPWLIDIHDGSLSDPGGISIPQLHQSDLVVLDYNLGPIDHGERALALLRTLAAKPHFNMVVVYTRGQDDDIGSVFWDIVEALTPAKWDAEPDAKAAIAGESIIESRKVYESELGTRLLDVMSRDIYLRERAVPGSQTDYVRAEMESILRADHSEVLADIASVDRWLRRAAHAKYVPRLACESYGQVAFRLGEPGPNWIRTDRIFITVISKRQRPSELEGALLTAIECSSPSPLELLMAKMRAQVAEHGAEAQAEVFRDSYLQAGWLSELLETNHSDRRRWLRTMVDRQWDALGSRLREELDRFAQRLAAHLGGCTKDCVNAVLR